MRILLFMVLISIAFLPSEKAQANSLGQAIENAKRFYNNLMLEEKKAAEKKQVAKRAYRPKSCPIFSSEYSDLQSKMQRVLNILENDKDCTSRVQGTMQNIKDDIGKMNQFQIDQEKSLRDRNALIYQARGGTVSEPTSPEIARQQLESQDRARQIGVVQSSLQSFTSLASTGACKKSLTASEGLSLMSDVVVGTTSYGLMSPSMTGTGVALAGMAVGSILKMISLLLVDKWDFDKEEDRNNFVKLNCTFFQLKSDMDEVGILQVKTQEHQQEYDRIQKQIVRIDTEIEKLQNALDKSSGALKMKEIINITRKLGVGKYDGQKNAELYYLFDSIKSFIAKKAITPSIKRNDDKKAGALIELFKYYKKLEGYLNDPGINMGNTGRSLHLNKTLQAYKDQKLIGNAQSGEQLWQTILRAKPVVIGTMTVGNQKVNQTQGPYEYFVDNFLKPVEWLIQYQKMTVNEGRLRQIIGSQQFKARIAISNLKKTLRSFKDRLETIEKIRNGAVFTDEDGGTMIKSNILLGFKEVDKALYGRVGDKFLEFSTKLGNNHIKRLKGLIENKVPQIKSAGANQSFCADANQIMLNYQISESMTNAAYDFLATNMDSFYQPNKRQSYLRWKTAWHQRKIQDHVKSITQFRQKYPKDPRNPQKSIIIPKTDKNIFYHVTYTPVASLMFRLKQMQPDIYVIQNYLDKARCTKRAGSKPDLSF